MEGMLGRKIVRIIQRAIKRKGEYGGEYEVKMYRAKRVDYGLFR